MEYAEVIYIRYESSETIERQGKYEDIRKFLSKGYKINKNLNGYWVLTKPSRVVVTLKNSFGENEFNMKNDILDYYNRQKISESLVEKFKSDVNNKMIEIYMDQNGYYSFK